VALTAYGFASQGDDQLHGLILTISLLGRPMSTPLRERSWLNSLHSLKLAVQLQAWFWPRA
jgi:hypothetical protein